MFYLTSLHIVCSKLSSDERVPSELQITSDMSKTQGLKRSKITVSLQMRDHCKIILVLSNPGKIRAIPSLESLLHEPSWKNAISVEFQKPYVSKLQKFLEGEASGKQPIFPPVVSIFSALNLCPFEKVKVVIIGQVLVNSLHFNFYLILRSYSIKHHP